MLRLVRCGARLLAGAEAEHEGGSALGLRSQPPWQRGWPPGIVPTTSPPTPSRLTPRQFEGWHKGQRLPSPLPPTSVFAGAEFFSHKIIPLETEQLISPTPYAGRVNVDVTKAVPVNNLLQVATAADSFLRIPARRHDTLSDAARRCSWTWVPLFRSWPDYFRYYFSYDKSAIRFCNITVLFSSMSKQGFSGKRSPVNCFFFLYFAVTLLNTGYVLRSRVLNILCLYTFVYLCSHIRRKCVYAYFLYVSWIRSAARPASLPHPFTPSYQ